MRTGAGCPADRGAGSGRGAGGRVRQAAWGRGCLLCLVALAGFLAGPRVSGAQAWTASAEVAGARELRQGRFRLIAFTAEERLAAALLESAVRADTFPGLARLRDTVTVMLAPDAATFASWAGQGAPDWGDAFAFPDERRIVMQGRDAGGDAGEPRQVLRHELAHLALAEALGAAAVPRWFDEGYASVAAGEWGRDEVLATSVGLVWRGVPTLDGLDSLFRGGADRASRAYALAHHAVAELQAMGRERGLALLFEHWRREGRFEVALRAAHLQTSGDFEKAWRSKVRRQYGLLAIAADLSVLSVLLVFLLGPLWWNRRKRLRERLQRMREADARQEARERESALAVLLGEAGVEGSPSAPATAIRPPDPGGPPPGA